MPYVLSYGQNKKVAGLCLVLGLRCFFMLILFYINYGVLIRKFLFENKKLNVTSLINVIHLFHFFWC